MPVKIIACEVMKEELLTVAHSTDVEFQFISMGLHRYPDKLRAELQNLLDATVGYSRVVLAFGLCGGAARNLKPSGFTLTIPRVHDCIPLLLGSRERFDRLAHEEKGTFYYTRGWDVKHEVTHGDLGYIDRIVNGPYDERNFINVTSEDTLDDTSFMAYDAKVLSSPAARV